MNDAKHAKGAGTPWLSVFRASEWGLVGGILLVLLLIYLLEPNHNFFGWTSQRTLVHQAALYGFLALGAAVVIVSGGIDLSIGSVMALSSVVFAKLVTEWLPGATRTGGPPSGIVVLAFVLTLLVGLTVGLIHAFMINQIKLPPFIATLATMAGLRSLATIISQNTSITVSLPNFRLLGRDPWYTVPIFAAAALTVGVMLRFTILGRHLYALGGNEAASRLSGLPTQRLKAVAYCLSGVLAALGGLMFMGRSGQGLATMGTGYELVAITAAVVGGCSLAGGVGSIQGTVLGLFLIQIIIKGTGLIPWGRVDSTQVEGLVLGTVVVLAVGLNQRTLTPRALIALARSTLRRSR